MRDKHMQEVIHVITRLAEPKLVPNSSPESLLIFEHEQACIKPNFLYMFNESFGRAANKCKTGFIDTLNYTRISEDNYLEVKMLWDELEIGKFGDSKIRAFSTNPETIERVIQVLELKYDEDEEVQEKKAQFIKCMLRLNQRLLMQDFMEQLSSERATVEKLAEYYHPVIDSSKSLRAIRTDKRVFDRLSKNALQNVMVFFDYKGADFLKMRCICKKTNNAYMQELKKRFNAERQFEKLNQEYLMKAQTGVTSFIEGCLPIPDKAPAG